MHVILDYAELLLRESCGKPEEWEQMQRQLYAPDPSDPASLRAWSEDEQLESFDAFMTALGG